MSTGTLTESEFSELSENTVEEKPKKKWNEDAERRKAYFKEYYQKHHDEMSKQQKAYKQKVNKVDEKKIIKAMNILEALNVKYLLTHNDKTYSNHTISSVNKA